MHDNGVRKPFSKVNLREEQLIKDFSLKYFNLIQSLSKKDILTKVTDWYHHPSKDNLSAETYKYSINTINYKQELFDILNESGATTKIFNWINKNKTVQYHLPIIPFSRDDINTEREKTLKTGDMVSYPITPFTNINLWGMYGQFLNGTELKTFYKARDKYYRIIFPSKRKNAKKITIAENRSYSVNGNLIPRFFFEVAYVEELSKKILEYFNLPVKRKDKDITNKKVLPVTVELDRDDVITNTLIRELSFDPLYLFTLTPHKINGVITDKTSDEIENYKTVCRNIILNNSPILLALKNEAEVIKSLNGLSSLRLHIDFKVSKKSFRVRASGRQWNAECDTQSAKRDKAFTKDGIDGNFDLHSAIFAVARLMNKGVFNADWDIKDELLSKHHYAKEDGIELTRQDLKALMMRLFFKKSCNDMLRLYKDSFWLDSYLKKNKEEEIEVKKITKYPKKKPQAPRLSDDVLLQINQDVEEMIGKTAPYYYNIFLIESIIEMRVIRRFLEKGKKIRNVYDCFYYSLEEYPNEENGDTNKEVIEIINSSAISVYRELNEYLEQGRYWGMKTVRDMINDMDNS